MSDNNLRQAIKNIIETVLCRDIKITDQGWEEIRKDTLNHLYCDNLMFGKPITPEDFINAFVQLAISAKRVA